MRGTLLLAVALCVGCGNKNENAPEPPPAPAAETVKPAPRVDPQPERTVSVFFAAEVESWDKWKKAFDGQAEARKGAGAIWHCVARDVQDEDRVYVHLVGTDLDAMKKGMTVGGVEGDPEMWGANDVEIDSPKGRIEGETFSLIGRHDAEDFDAWKQRKQLGVLGGSISRAADDENVIIFHLMVDDPGKLAEALGGENTRFATGQVVEVSLYR